MASRRSASSPQALREDEEDLASFRARTREKPLDYESFLAKLKAAGAL